VAALRGKHSESLTQSVEVHRELSLSSKVTKVATVTAPRAKVSETVPILEIGNFPSMRALCTVK
jgi:hypothetical protein